MGRKTKLDQRCEFRYILDAKENDMRRIYDSIVVEHFAENRQMAFISGPRQVGKTTTTLSGNSDKAYLNWDKTEDRLIISQGTQKVFETLQLATLQKINTKIIFDEIHKYQHWKTFLKGFFDTYGTQYQIAVTGSARLDTYKQGGDSLMGRYFLYRMHPLSLAELTCYSIDENIIRSPIHTSPDQLQQLFTFGGFPEPFLKGNTRFYNRWRRLRTEQLFNEDIRDFTNILELKQLSILAELLNHQSGQLTNYSTLANQTKVSVDTVQRWIQTLEAVYYCFAIRPWFANVPKSIRKQPKIYLWDWSLVNDRGARNENLIASHLHKAVHFWTDAGFGAFNLFYLRDKNKREVDFLVTRDQKPWFMVEVKSSASGHISKSLVYFHEVLKTQCAFQVEMDAAYVDRDCFETTSPICVPALTFLSQLV